MSEEEELNLEEKIQRKKKEVEHYAGVLERYAQSGASGRWYDMGRRRLDGLKEQLNELQQQYQSPISLDQIEINKEVEVNPESDAQTIHQRLETLRDQSSQKSETRQKLIKSFKG